MHVLKEDINSAPKKSQPQTSISYNSYSGMNVPNSMWYKICKSVARNPTLLSHRPSNQSQQQHFAA